MLLAVDIGNSFVKIALLREEKVAARLSLETERGKSADEYLARIASALRCWISLTIASTSSRKEWISSQSLASGHSSHAL